MKTTLRHHYIFLADILANGVAIMLILIIIFLSIKKEQDEQDLITVSKVGAVMSREIASSVVMNNLPSSGPARLHDYAHPRYKKAPLIKLHQNYLLIQDQGKDKPTLNWRLTRNELLLKNNRFDDFLQSLDKVSKTRIRVDISDIRLFYLVLSILKEHNIDIRHWHFEPIATPNKVAEKSILLETLQIENEPTQDETTIGEKPENKLLPPNPPLIPTESDFSQLKITQDIPKANSVGTAAGETPSTTKEQALFDSMLDIMAQKRGVPNPIKIERFIENLRFSFAGETLDEKISIEKTKNTDNLLTQSENDEANQPIEKQLLNIIISYLDSIQQRYEQHLFVDPSLSDFAEHRSQKMLIYQNEIEQIYRYYEQEKTSTLNYKTHKSEQITLAIPLNQNLQQLNVYRTHDYADAVQKTSFYLYAEPTIYQALEISLQAGDVLLLPYHRVNENVEQWFISAVIDAKLSNIRFGFVHGQLINNQLHLSNDETKLHINNQHQQNSYDSIKNDYQLWQVLLYLLLIIGVILFIIKRRL